MPHCSILDLGIFFQKSSNLRWHTTTTLGTTKVHVRDVGLAEVLGADIADRQDCGAAPAIQQGQGLLRHVEVAIGRRRGAC